jgi:hypothetical protein
MFIVKDALVTEERYLLLIVHNEGIEFNEIAI